MNCDDDDDDDVQHFFLGVVKFEFGKKSLYNTHAHTPYTKTDTNSIVSGGNSILIDTFFLYTRTTTVVPNGIVDYDGKKSENNNQ